MEGSLKHPNDIPIIKDASSAPSETIQDASFIFPVASVDEHIASTIYNCLKKQNYYDLLITMKYDVIIAG